MIPAELGCAQNADGSLKEAHEIEFQFSRSTSPIDLLSTRTAPAPPSPNDISKALDAQVHPLHGKVPKKKGRKPRVVTNSRRNLTGALVLGRQRNSLTYQDKIDILDFMEGPGAGWSQIAVAEHFRAKFNFKKLNQSTISLIKKRQIQLRDMQHKSASQLSFKRPRRTRFPQLEDALRMWHLQAETHIKVIPAMLVEKGRQFAKELGIPEDECIKFSPGWMDSYRQRFGYRLYKFFGEAGSCTPEAVAAARVHMIKLLKDYSPECIYNMDETGLYYRMPPDRGLATQQLSGVKQDKMRITMGFTANADGSDIRNPFFIGKARKPRCFKKKEASSLGFEYYWNSSAWMAGSICQLFLDRFDRDMRAMGRHALLCIDNAPSHVFDDSNFTNTKVVFLVPNMTSHIQPMDAGIIRAFKAHYRRLFILQALDRYEDGDNKIYFIDQLRGMNLAIEAWSYVKQATVANCWRHAGILETENTKDMLEKAPLDRATVVVDAGIEDAVNGLQNALSELSGQHVALKNLKTAEELLSIPEENVTEATWTDEEIIKQVQLDKREEDGQHLDEVDDDPEPTSVMSVASACSALAELSDFFQDQAGDEFASARALLPKIRRQLRKELTALKEQTDIRSYFTKQ